MFLGGEYYYDGPEWYQQSTTCVAAGSTVPAANIGADATCGAVITGDTTGAPNFASDTRDAVTLTHTDVWSVSHSIAFSVVHEATL